MIALILLILLVLVVYYAYYRNKQFSLNGSDSSFTGFSSSDTKLTAELTETKRVNQTLTTFLKSQLNSNGLEELKTKLNGKTLDKILEQNEDYETEVDSLTRTKNSLEQDLLAQSNAFQSRIREKDRELKRVKEELTNSRSNLGKLREDLVSEKQQHKGSLTRINKLTQQITSLTKEKQALSQTHQEQLKVINLLFDPQAKDYTEIDFNGLYSLLEGMAKEKKDD